MTNEFPEVAGVEFRDLDRFPGYCFGSDFSAWSRWTLGRKPRIGTDWKEVGHGRSGSPIVRIGGRSLSIRNIVLEAFPELDPAAISLASWPDMPGVRFRDIPGYSDNCAGDDGSIWSRLKTWGHKPAEYSNGWHSLLPYINQRNGYAYVHVRRDGDRQKTTRVHRLILEAFVGTRPRGMVGCHGDGNRSNNRLDNLRWDTQENNEADKILHGTNLVGEDVHSARLREGDVAEIKRLAAQGFDQLELSRRFGVTRRNINYILNGKIWRHVACEAV